MMQRITGRDETATIDPRAFLLDGALPFRAERALIMDPVHVATIGIVSLAFARITPPFGPCLLIACSIADMRLYDVLSGVPIMPVPMLSVLTAIIMWPDLVLFPPNL